MQTLYLASIVSRRTFVHIQSLKAPQLQWRELGCSGCWCEVYNTTPSTPDVDFPDCNFRSYCHSILAVNSFNMSTSDYSSSRLNVAPAGALPDATIRSFHGTPTSDRACQYQPVEQKPQVGMLQGTKEKREISRQQWEDMKSIIQRIYIDENKPFPYLAHTLRTEHGFEPTQVQCSPDCKVSNADSTTANVSSLARSRSGASARTFLAQRGGQSCRIFSVIQTREFLISKTGESDRRSLRIGKGDTARRQALAVPCRLNQRNVAVCPSLLL